MGEEKAEDNQGGEEEGEKKEEKKEEKTPDEKIEDAAKEENAGAGSSPIEDAKETLKKLEEQNKLMAENLKKATALQAEMMLSGKTTAGQPSQTQEEKEIDSAREMLKGTGFEDRLFPKKKD